MVRLGVEDGFGTELECQGSVLVMLCDEVRAVWAMTVMRIQIHETTWWVSPFLHFRFVPFQPESTEGVTVTVNFLTNCHHYTPCANYIRY